MGIGELAALGAALLWAVSSMFWGQVNLSALGINLFKSVFGSVYLLVHLFLVAVITRTGMFEASWESHGWLALSSLIGIVLGDTLYFRSLQILGPRLSLMVASVCPIAASLLGWLWLGEGLAFFAVAGIVMTVIGVVSVVADRRARVEQPNILPGKLSTGVLCGIAASITQAAGAVLAKTGMRDCGAIEATLIRLAVAAAVTLAIVIVARKTKQIYERVTAPGSLRILLLATAIGTWLGIWLSQLAFKEASSVALAQTLLATSPLFAIPIVRWYYGHRISALSVIGTLIAVAGIALTVGFDREQEKRPKVLPVVVQVTHFPLFSHFVNM